MLQLPEPPEFDDAVIEKCITSKYVTPIVFEWYKYVAQVAYILALIPRDSILLRPLPENQYAVLVGLLNRCARLMLSVVKISSSGVHGETVRILDRCIVESAVKLHWLSVSNKNDKFDRYLADGLKHELRFREEIKQQIQRRSDGELIVEQKMLRSVDRFIKASGLTEQAIQQTKKMPDFRTICEEIGLNRLLYLIAQGLGSHSVHGSWSDLLLYYLDREGDEEWRPRANDVETNVLQFIFVAIFVSEALAAFAKFVFNPKNLVQEIEELLSDVRDELLYWQGVSEGDDYFPANS